MASNSNHYALDTSTQSSSQRSTAMALALVSAVLLSPLYNADRRTKLWGSGFVLPAVLGGLIIAIRTVSTSRSDEASSPVVRSGGSSWGLAGVLVMLVFVLSWQHSAKQFFWR